jgi:hypothetical protein
MMTSDGVLRDLSSIRSADEGTGHHSARVKSDVCMSIAYHRDMTDEVSGQSCHCQQCSVYACT